MQCNAMQCNAMQCNVMSVCLSVRMYVCMCGFVAYFSLFFANLCVVWALSNDSEGKKSIVPDNQGLEHHTSFTKLILRSVDIFKFLSFTVGSTICVCVWQKSQIQKTRATASLHTRLCLLLAVVLSTFEFLTRFGLERKKAKQDLHNHTFYFWRCAKFAHLMWSATLPLVLWAFQVQLCDQKLKKDKRIGFSKQQLSHRSSNLSWVSITLQIPAHQRWVPKIWGPLLAASSLACSAALQIHGCKMMQISLKFQVY